MVKIRFTKLKTLKTKVSKNSKTLQKNEINKRRNTMFNKMFGGCGCGGGNKKDGCY